MITKSLFTNVYKSPNKDRTWWIDSASDVHICYDKDLFDDYESIRGKVIKTANSTDMIIKEKGSVTLYLDVDGESKAVCLKDVHHVPESAYNLFPVGVIESKGFEF